jgi:hypothetical protein
MVYHRGGASDYDDWKTEGWTLEDILPIFKKVRCFNSYLIVRLNRRAIQMGISPSHGYSGPIAVSKESIISRQFIEVLKDRFNVEFCNDLHDFKVVNKVLFGGNTATGIEYVHRYLQSNTLMDLIAIQQLILMRTI